MHLVLYFGHFFGDKRGGQVGEEYNLVVAYFGEFLDYFDEMLVLDMDSATVRDHDQVRIELSHLVHQKVLNDEPHEVALMVFHIFFGFHDFLELMVEAAHADGKGVDVLVEVLNRLIVLVFI